MKDAKPEEFLSLDDLKGEILSVGQELGDLSSSLSLKIASVINDFVKQNPDIDDYELTIAISIVSDRALFILSERAMLEEERKAQAAMSQAFEDVNSEQDTIFDETLQEWEKRSSNDLNQTA